MLRITPLTSSSAPVFVLEGQLAGLWAKELARLTRANGSGKGSLFDLENVFYVDSQGEETLRWLNRLGARFITDTGYGKSLCERLKLHRVSASEAGLPNLPKLRRNH